MLRELVELLGVENFAIIKNLALVFGGFVVGGLCALLFSSFVGLNFRYSYELEDIIYWETKVDDYPITLIAPKSRRELFFILLLSIQKRILKLFRRDGKRFYRKDLRKIKYVFAAVIIVITLLMAFIFLASFTYQGSNMLQPK